MMQARPFQAPTPDRYDAALTDIILLQPSQGIDTLARKRLVRHIQLTIPVHAAARAKELDTRFDQAGQPEHEQDEGAQDDDAGEQHALRDQHEDQDQEEDGEGGGGDLVGEEPVGGGLSWGRGVGCGGGGGFLVGGGRAYQGIPNRICCWTVRKKANIPNVVAAAASMMISQKLSWASGQWYFRRRSTTRTSVIFAVVVVGLKEKVT